MKRASARRATSRNNENLHMFICRNQSCGAEWALSDVVIKNEGQGLLFRCPMCGARNYVERHDSPEGEVSYEQIADIDLKTKR
jgi:transcription elongation factor Elf1